MSEHGFIDPTSGIRRKADRLDAVIGLLLPLIDVTALSSEAQRLLTDLRSGDEAREYRAVQEFRRMTEDDPLPTPAPRPVAAEQTTPGTGEVGSGE